MTAFHWHGDIFDLPPGATPLAASDLTAIQAFRAGQADSPGPAYGILFHLEVTREQIDAMCRAFPEELRQGGTTAEAVAAGAPRHLAELARQGGRLFALWAKKAAALR